MQLAKLRMLEFYFDFMDVFIDRKDFEYCEMDTDSAYMAISSTSFKNVIKPELKDKFEECLKGFCGGEDFKADEDMHWFPRTCCQKHEQYDRRTPGLFKIEFEGDEMIGLCSKTYIVTTKEGEYKFSSKGINKQRITDPFTIFKSVLETKEKGSGVNIGFRPRNNGVCTYMQQRDGFSYLYCKRKVLEDGSRTEPLDTCLQPSKKPRQSILSSF